MWKGRLTIMPLKSPLNRIRPALSACLCVAAMGLSGCGEKPAAGAAATPGAGAATRPGAAASAPRVSVGTVLAERKDVPVMLESTGSVVPIASVEVRPQLTSLVSRVHIREGQFVRAGDVLFTLDARADEANVAKVRAQMVRDQAALADARRQLARSQELLAQNFISAGAVDTARAQVEAQSALVTSDRAALDAARLALSYARVTAPSAGRVGAIPVAVGSAVQANQTALVTITQLDPINVAFNLPQRHLTDALAALKGQGARIEATLPDGGGALVGRLQFVDSAVDAASGTVKVKAEFPNREQLLWPGAFVKVGMTVRVLKAAVVVPQAAIIQSPKGGMVYVVDAQGQAAARPVQVLHALGEMAAVKGVEAGERVVLDGRQNLRPGTQVVERAPPAPAAQGMPKAAP